jgi:hypothetical protein
MTSYVVSKKRCPSCASKGKDTRKDNLAIYSDGHEFCFSCLYFVPGDKIQTIKQQLYSSQGTSAAEAVVLPEDVESHPSEEALNWFFSFGFDFGDVVKNRILWSNSYKRLIFTIYDDSDNLIAWQGRYFGNDERPKWLSKGSIHDIVYTRGLPDDDLVLVEDIVSCIKLGNCGVYSGCLFGSNPSNKQLNRYRLVTDSFTFWLDNDKARESIQFKRKSEAMGIPAKCVFSTLDPKEYSKHQIETFLKRNQT